MEGATTSQTRHQSTTPQAPHLFGSIDHNASRTRRPTARGKDTHVRLNRSTSFPQCDDLRGRERGLCSVTARPRRCPRRCACACSPVRGERGLSLVAARPLRCPLALLQGVHALVRPMSAHSPCFQRSCVLSIPGNPPRRADDSVARCAAQKYKSISPSIDVLSSPSTAAQPHTTITRHSTRPI